MNQNKIDRLLNGYSISVHHPEVSGMEHLNLLQIRSQLVVYEPQMDDEQLTTLQRADEALFLRAEQFLQAIEQIADLASWRQQEGYSAAHWWWYLDVIAYLPVQVLPARGKREMAVVG